VAVNEGRRDVIEADEEYAAERQVIADRGLNIAFSRFASRHMNEVKSFGVSVTSNIPEL
jgi:hypothetical protein